MKRTTLVLDDDLLQQLKREAASTGHTIKTVVNTLLRRALGAAKPRRHFRLAWKTYCGKLLPGVRLDDRNSLFDAMEDE